MCFENAPFDYSAPEYKVGIFPAQCLILRSYYALKMQGSSKPFKLLKSMKIQAGPSGVSLLASIWRRRLNQFKIYLELEGMTLSNEGYGSELDKHIFNFISFIGELGSQYQATHDEEKISKILWTLFRFF